jgi:hypothetical protein
MPCEAARQRHGDGGHQSSGGSSAREAAAVGGGGGGGSLAAAWRAERRQRGDVGSFLSAGRWEWKRGGGGGVGSALALVAARPQRGYSKQHCDSICSAVLAEAVRWQCQQSGRGSAAEAR